MNFFFKFITLHYLSQKLIHIFASNYQNLLETT